MIKVGLLSDTHAYWDDKYAEYFKDCDEIWHAGDIGSDLLAAKFEALKPFKAVYGNIDGQAIRLQYPKVAHFKVEDVNVMMTHIGGYPGRYNPEIRKELYDTRPNLFISGHSHILKVVFDRSLKCLLLLFCSVYCLAQQATIPVPKPFQLKWHQAEMGAVFHYDLHVFDGVRALSDRQTDTLFHFGDTLGYE